MTLGTPAVFAGSATHTTRTVRQGLLGTVFGIPVISHANSATATTRGGGYGVALGGDLAVTGTGALGYSIAAGHFALPGTFATAQGLYGDYNDAAVTGTLPARNATNPYIAYICGRVRDTDEDATGAEITDITVIQGTAATPASPPSVPSSLGSLIILSEALVPSSANGGPVVFTERRMYLTAIGGIMRVTSATRPTGAALTDGQHWFELDTGLRYHTHNGAAICDTPGMNVYGSYLDGSSGGRLYFQGSSTIVTTDGAGSLTINYPVGYSTTPVVQVNNGDYNTGGIMLAFLNGTPNTTGFVIRAFDQAGAAIASTTLRINWTAIGFV
jgi:hypothetical protein